MEQDRGIEFDDFLDDVRESGLPDSSDRLEEWVTIGASVTPVVRDDIIEDRIERLADDLEIPESTALLALSVYDEYQSERGDLAGTALENIAAASLYCACKVTSEPLDPTDFSEAEPALERRILLRRSKKIATTVGLDPGGFVSAEQYVDRYCEELDLDSKTSDRAAEIVDELGETGIASGKSPSGWAGAAVYNACRDTGNEITQAEIADLANVTTVTIRNRYQEQRMVLRDVQELPREPSALIEEVSELVDLSEAIRNRAITLIEAARTDGVPIDNEPVAWTLAALRLASQGEGDPLGWRVLSQYTDQESQALRNRAKTLRTVRRGGSVEGE